MEKLLIKRMIYGDPNMEDIETTDIENFNGVLREGMDRFVRSNKCSFKKKRRLKHSIQL